LTSCKVSSVSCGVSSGLPCGAGLPACGWRAAAACASATVIVNVSSVSCAVVTTAGEGEAEGMSPHETEGDGDGDCDGNGEGKGEGNGSADTAFDADRHVEHPAQPCALHGSSAPSGQSVSCSPHLVGVRARAKG
jgi:hypothetical protein